MNSKLSVKEQERLSHEAAMAIPGMKAEAPQQLSRQQKLARWAFIVRTYEGELVLYHRLEHYPTPDYAKMAHPHTAFALASRDPILSAAGLKDASVGASMEFFELSREELHAFSCDCGGHISNKTMANRIEAIGVGVNPITFARGLLSRIAGQAG